MYSIILEWKNFNVDLQMIYNQIKLMQASHCGISADSVATLWFEETLSSEDKEAIENYWNSITEESPEALGYVSTQTLRDACASLKEGLISKSWDEMSLAERKLVLGQMPTREELGL